LVATLAFFSLVASALADQVTPNERVKTRLRAKDQPGDNGYPSAAHTAATNCHIFHTATDELPMLAAPATVADLAPELPMSVSDCLGKLHPLHLEVLQ